MAPRTQRSDRQAPEAAPALERKQTDELALVPHRDALETVLAFRPERGEQHPGLVERIRLERIRGEVLPGRRDGGHAGAVAKDDYGRASHAFAGSLRRR